MKKLIFSFVVLFAFMASVNSQPMCDPISPADQLYDNAFHEAYQKALELNHDRFINLDRIQIGDTILFQSRTGVGTEAWIAEAPENGVNDCIWRLTHKYLKGQLKTTPVPAPKAELVSPEEKESFWFSDLFWVLVIISLFVGIVLILFFFGRYLRRLEVVDINANPVLPGGLSNDASRAREQINGITAGLQIVKVERGRIFGTATSGVSMHFSDGLKYVNLISGDDAYRVTEFDGSISYYRQHCGNLIAPVARGQFNLPDDWVFVPYANEQSTWSAPEAIQNEEVKPEHEVEEELPLEVFVHMVEDSTLTGKDVATILEAAGKMGNVPSSISVGDLTIKFKDHEKEE